MTADQYFQDAFNKIIVFLVDFINGILANLGIDYTVSFEDWTS